MNDVGPKHLAALPLREQAELLLRLPARERLELLLHAPQPMRLVRTLPESEVYFTVRDIGPHDALPLIALASADQLIHLIDLESWRGDRFDPERSGAWVALLLESGEPTLVRFMRNSDDEFLALLFCRWIRVREIEEEEGDEGFLSPDRQHLFFPTIPEHAPAIRRIAEMLLEDDPNRYARVLRLAQWELPSELEESSLRWRGSRLEERGFPDLESALSVYAAPAGLPASGAQAPAASDDALVAPRTALRAGAVAPSIVAWLEALSGPARERVLFELAAVANKILVADRADAGDPAAHRAAMERTVAFVGLALAARGATRDEDALRLFEEVHVLDLFREGFAPAATLQSAARRLVRDGWPKLHPRALETLDRSLRGPLAALLERRPVVCDPQSPGERREFRAFDDLAAARHALALADLLGRVVTATVGWDLSGMLDSLAPGADAPTIGSLWITSVARHEATAQLGAGPIPPALADAFRARAADVRSHEATADAIVATLRAADAIDDAETATLRHHTIEALATFARDGTPALLVGG